MRIGLIVAIVTIAFTLPTSADQTEPSSASGPNLIDQFWFQERFLEIIREWEAVPGNSERAEADQIEEHFGRASGIASICEESLDGLRSYISQGDLTGYFMAAALEWDDVPCPEGGGLGGESERTIFEDHASDEMVMQIVNDHFKARIYDPGAYAISPTLLVRNHYRGKHSSTNSADPQSQSRDWSRTTLVDSEQRRPSQLSDWLKAFVAETEERIDELRTTRLALHLAEEDQEEIVWALIELAELQHFRKFAIETQEFLADGVGLSAHNSDDRSLSTLDGCWMSYDGLMEVEVDGDTLFARDSFDGLWVGVVGSGGLVFTQSFSDIGAYRVVAERMAGGEISAELDAIVETLFAAGVQHEISIHLPDNLTDIQMLEAVFRQTLVAEPVVGTVTPTYRAVIPDEAVHGTVWQFQHMWARASLC